MPKHHPIKFETSLEPTLTKYLIRAMKENKMAKSILNATLALIALGGILTIAAITPAAIPILNKILKQHKRKHREEYNKIWKNFYKLKAKGALEFIKNDNGYLVYRLSQGGKERIKKLIFDEIFLGKPKEWDNKWRLVIFDIPELRRRERTALRQKLRDIGFYQCQKSAWIHPFPCLEEIEFLKEVLNISPFVKLFVVDEMTDGKIIYHFRNLIKSVV